MKLKIIVLFIVALCFCSRIAYAHYNRPMELYVGAVELLNVTDIERVVVGNGKVISAKVLDGKGILVIAEQPGESDLQLWLRNGTLKKLSVTVTPDNTLSTVAQLKARLGAFPKLKLAEKDGVIIIQGDLPPEREETLEKIIEGNSNVISLVDYKEFAKVIEPMVKIKVQVVEFKKSTLNNIGVQWDTAMAGPAFGAAKAFSSNPIFSVASPGQYVEGITEARAGSYSVNSRELISLGMI